MATNISKSAIQCVQQRTTIYLGNGVHAVNPLASQYQCHLLCQFWTVLPSQIRHVMLLQASQVQLLLQQSFLATWN